MTALGKDAVRLIGVSLILLTIIAFTVGYNHPPDSQSRAITNNASSINTTNPSGITNTINIGSDNLQFDAATCNTLISKLPPGRPIVLESIGPSFDQAIADRYQKCLENKGVKIQQRVQIGILIPSPDGRIIIGSTAAPNLVVVIAPGAN